MTATALPFQVYGVTHSSLDVGLLSLAQLGPLLLCSIVGGVVADAYDKRRVLALTNIAALTCSLLLALLVSGGHPALWGLFVLAAASSGVGSLFLPSVRSLSVLILRADLRPAGFALQAGYGRLAMLAGPAIAGLLLGAVGPRGVYLTDVGSFAVAIAMFTRVASSPPPADREGASPVQDLREGLRFLKGSAAASVFELDLLATIFGMPVALFPALAVRLGGGAALYGFITSALPAGGLIATLTSGWARRIHRQGRAMIVAVAAWGVAIALMGVTRSSALVLFACAAAGAADVISGVYRYSITAGVTPDELRGRVSGAEGAVYAGGPALGNVESGVAAGLFGLPVAIVSGGVACLLAAGWFALRVPRLSTFRTAATEHRG